MQQFSILKSEEKKKREEQRVNPIRPQAPCDLCPSLDLKFLAGKYSTLCPISRLVTAHFNCFVIYLLNE